MPFYDYFCESNGKTVEVFHSLEQKLRTWGEVCRYAAIDPGDIPLETPVVRLLGKGRLLVQRFKNIDKEAPSHKLEL